MKKTLLLAAGLSACAAANAAITQSADSSAFQFKYEMDVAPFSQDLDSNGTIDWRNGGTGNNGTPSVSGGFANNTNTNQIFRGDDNNSIWRVLANTAAADWTMEISVAKTGGTQGTSGWFGIATANLNESNSLALFNKDDRVTVSGVDYLVGTNFASGAQNIFRITHDAADNAYYVWVNNTLLNTSLSTPIAGTNGSTFDNSTFIGDYGSAFAGNYSIDYIRLDSAAFAAIPEPSTYGLLGAGALAAAALVRRRRKAA